MEKLKFVETIVNEQEFPHSLNFRVSDADTFFRQLVVRLCPDRDLSIYDDLSFEFEHDGLGLNPSVSIYGIRIESDEELATRENKELEQLRELISRHPEAAKDIISDY